MNNAKRIGLDASKMSELSDKLNDLLANYQLHYQNLRGLHWNIKGPRFFELHLKFEEYYLDAAEKVDLIAERILTLGATPLHTYSDYLEHAKLNVAKNLSEDQAAVQHILESLSILIDLERPILDMASELGDEGTADMMTAFIQQQEKESWMLNAWLGNK
ncbi:MAG: DNA starvation/stationary phase protection protein [Bacteroidota bacterium]|nr:DNA starvation/stationary phase protection protein [Bacteroidota bacterium]MDX5427403.1 DNA starvation/stationary phase protection protein [Bacteroidota bacterium]MDX5448882.1 DNA starvation/stationary phase protection protein [Bacteroidota bacterium]MDX5505348.1 DNA starvation/stationary phase protection protein [Bacteroidota bacterium]